MGRVPLFRVKLVVKIVCCLTSHVTARIAHGKAECFGHGKPAPGVLAVRKTKVGHPVYDTLKHFGRRGKYPAGIIGYLNLSVRPFFDLIAELLARTYHESQQKPTYSVRRLIGIEAQEKEPEGMLEGWR